MSIAVIEKIADEVEGWLSVEEGRTLYRLASQAPKGSAIVEIGSWKGKSTVWLAGGARAGYGAMVYSIDPHTGTQDEAERGRQQANDGRIWSFDDFQKNIQKAGVSDSVTPLVMYSGDAHDRVKEPVSLIFIDGDHTYEGVRADFEGWSPRVVQGGVVSFHDTNINIYPGIKKVVSEGLYASPIFARLGTVDSLTYATRVEHASVLERTRKRIRHILRYPDDYAGTLRWRLIPGPLRRLARRVMAAVSN